MRVTHAKASSEGIIEGADWDADHVAEGLVADDDPRLSDARTPTSHAHAEYADAVHSHAYADPAHTHTLEQHSHPLEAHTHDTSHVHTASEVGAAETAHTHDTTHSHDLTAYATDADLAAHAATPHGGSSTHPAGSHVTPQSAIANVSRNGNATTQTQNLQNKVDEMLVALRAAGVIAS